MDTLEKNSVHVSSLLFYQVLKDEHEALVGVDDVVERDDVGVFEVLQQRHYGDGRMLVNPKSGIIVLHPPFPRGGGGAHLL